MLCGLYTRCMQHVCRLDTSRSSNIMGKLEDYLSKPVSLPDSSGMLLRDLAYERIKDAIRNAGVSPGDPLSENSISKALGISRTPVRAAIQQLAQEGLLEIIPGRAVTVASQTFSDVIDVVHIRSLLEPELVRLATENISPSQITSLEAAMEEMEAAIEADDRPAWSRADATYHDILGRACPNKMLAESVIQLRNRVHHMANVDTQSNPERLTECTQEHREILDAIVARDSNAARAAARRHLDALRASLLDSLRYE